MAESAYDSDELLNTSMLKTRTVDFWGIITASKTRFYVYLGNWILFVTEQCENCEPIL